VSHGTGSQVEPDVVATDAAADFIRRVRADSEACLAAALDYLALGWSPLALCNPDHVGMGTFHKKKCNRPGKRPWHKWKEFQERRPTADELRDFWREHASNVGIALGPVSGLIRVDADGPAGEARLQELAQGDLPETLEFVGNAAKGGRGLLYKIPEGVVFKTTLEIPKGGEELRFQAKGAQTVLPPSRHPLGFVYAWKPGHGPDDIDAALCPAWLVREMQEVQKPANARPADGSTTAADRTLALSALAGLKKERADEYTPWVEVGMCLHSVADDDEMLEAWTHWSEHSEKYRDGDCSSKWLTFKRDGLKTLGSLIHWAEQDGWKRPSPQLIGEDVIHLTDRGNAMRMVRSYGQSLRHCHPWRKWLAWDETRWRLDNTALVTSWAKRTISSLWDWAGKQIEARKNAGELPQGELDKLQVIQKWCLKSEAAPRINAMLDLVRSEEYIPILPDHLDREPMLLNCPNGTLDLTTGKLRQHKRLDYLTQLCPVHFDPAARCPRWQKHLDTIFQRDEELLVFIHRVVGLMLTGDIREQILLIFWGKGSNGKSTLVNVLLELLGRDYSMKAAPDLLVSRSGDSHHPTERMDLFGRRLAVCSETPQGKRLNEVIVKEWTGGEPVRGRRMKEDSWEFLPTHKIVLCTNHKPEVTGRDEGIWRRLRLVPFEVTFWNPDDVSRNGKTRDAGLKQDKTLQAKLRAELPGILTWAVRGCLEWQKSGLTVPSKVQAATQQYRVDEDVLGAFLAERCIVGSQDYREKAANLYAAYKAWFEASGEKHCTQKVFGEAMGEWSEFERYTNNGTWYRGVALRAAQDENGQEEERKDHASVGG
jgi:P4 family phage/plasmid primase-like protien